MTELPNGFKAICFKRFSNLRTLSAVTLTADDLSPAFFADFFFHNQLADAVRRDFSGQWIFYAVDFPFDFCLHGASFKGKVAAFHGAVFKHKIIAVAEGLGSDNVAIYQRKVF